LISVSANNFNGVLTEVVLIITIIVIDMAVCKHNDKLVSNEKP